MLIRKSSIVLLLLALLPGHQFKPISAQIRPSATFGYSDFAGESAIEAKFLAVPDAKLAGEELKTLTAEPHMAATPEDHKTALLRCRQVPRRRP